VSQVVPGCPRECQGGRWLVRHTPLASQANLGKMEQLKGTARALRYQRGKEENGPPAKRKRRSQEEICKKTGARKVSRPRRSECDESANSRQLKDLQPRCTAPLAGLARTLSTSSPISSPTFPPTRSAISSRGCRGDDRRGNEGGVGGGKSQEGDFAPQTPWGKHG